jgi:arabinan endo-1,5-alpha-L-arabinosidase
VGPLSPGRFVTDGPFLHRATGGELLMLWSSFRDGRYRLGAARSKSGNVLGPWTHDPDPIYADDGGHGMFFRTFGGRLLLAIHSPNGGGKERAKFLGVVEEGGRLRVDGGVR